MEIAPGSVKTMAPPGRPAVQPTAFTKAGGAAAWSASVSVAKRHPAGVAMPVGRGVADSGEPESASA